MLFQDSTLTSQEKDKITQTCLDKLLQAVRLSLKKSDYNYQSAVMNMLSHFAPCKGVNEERLMHCIRMMFFFLMIRESEVTREATLAVEEMCEMRGVTPRDMLNWYRHDIIKLIVAISATNFYCHEISLYKSLVHVSIESCGY